MCKRISYAPNTKPQCVLEREEEEGEGHVGQVTTTSVGSRQNRRVFPTAEVQSVSADIGELMPEAA